MAANIIGCLDMLCAKLAVPCADQALTRVDVDRLTSDVSSVREVDDGIGDIERPKPDAKRHDPLSFD